MNRQEANREILNELSKAVEKYPDLRFHQLLYNMDVQVPVINKNERGEMIGMHFQDLHHEESVVTFDRITKDY